MEFRRVLFRSDNVPQDASVPTAKLDPETLEIRARPRRAIRFRRGVIIGVAALGSTSLMVVAWMALRPGIYRQVVQESELSEPNAKAATNALGKLPASYGDVPRLGPPLPGDLGRPIMKAQREMVTEEGVSTGQRSEEHTSELQSLMRISYAVFCLKKKNKKKERDNTCDACGIQ